MRKYAWSLVGVMLALCAMGCQVQPPSGKSVNIQRSLIRSGGDCAVTVSLDVISDDAMVPEVQKKTKEICIAVQAFLQTGKVADLTIPEITGELRKLIPADYQFLFDILLAQIQGITVDTQKIGANNVERLNSVCVGVIRGCDLYDMKYRSVKNVGAPVARDVASKEAQLQAFGAKMRQEMKVR